MQPALTAIPGHDFPGLARCQAVRDHIVTGAGEGVAGIIGAGIAIIKVDGLSLADQIVAQGGALFPGGAGITVVAARSLRLVQNDAAILIRVGPDISKRVTKDHADAWVVGRGTVLVLGLMGAVPIRWVADVDGANLAVIARLRLPGTDPVQARLSAKAGVGRVARRPVQGQIRTPLGAVADVLGAIVVVITKMDKISPHLVGFIHEAIAIIIQPIADFRGGVRCVAFAQAILSANPLALAAPSGSRHLAIRPEAQGDGFLGAIAGPGLGHALFQFDAIHGGHQLAGKSSRTPFSPRARTATKGAFTVVGNARIVSAGAAGAVTAGGTWFAKIGVIRDAEPDDIRVRLPHLLTIPTGGALLLTAHRADALANVLHAPPGLTLTVLCARVEEAPFPRVALRH